MQEAAANRTMEVMIGPATSFAAACILLVLLLVAAQLCLTINSVQVSLPENFVKNFLKLR